MSLQHNNRYTLTTRPSWLCTGSSSTTSSSRILRRTGNCSSSSMFSNLTRSVKKLVWKARLNSTVSRLSYLWNQSRDASLLHLSWSSKISPPSPSTEAWPRRRGCQDTNSSRISRSVFSWPQICSAEVNTGFNLFLLSSIFPQSCETCSKTFF